MQSSCCKEELISVIVPTYNQSLRSILETVDSIVKQKGICIQIVICDDGSQTTYERDIEEYFIRIEFCNYKMLMSEENRGTVLNLLNGVKNSDGEYIKVIGPGDLLIGEYCLRDWISSMKESNYRWSFCDVVFYTGTFPDRKAVSVSARPRTVTPYIRNDISRIRWNYCVFGDIAVGAAMLSERSLILKYLELIAGKVIYAEDNIYRMMMFDGETGYYYPKASILYEVGAGISTSGNKAWIEKVVKDSEVADEIMLKRSRKSEILQQQMLRASVILKRRKQTKTKIPLVKWELIFNIDKIVSHRKAVTIDIENDPFFSDRFFDNYL